MLAESWRISERPFHATFPISAASGSSKAASASGRSHGLLERSAREQGENEMQRSSDRRADHAHVKVAGSNESLDLPLSFQRVNVLRPGL